MGNERFDEYTRYWNEGKERQELLVESGGDEASSQESAGRGCGGRSRKRRTAFSFHLYSAVNATANPVTDFYCTRANIAVRTPPRIRRCLNDRLR